MHWPLIGTIEEGRERQRKAIEDSHTAGRTYGPMEDPVKLGLPADYPNQAEWSNDCAGGNTRGMTPEEFVAWQKSLKAIHNPKYRPKPEGAPLTKTELKRKAVRERKKARMAAWLEKHPAPKY